jgi:hypothetical protein
LKVLNIISYSDSNIKELNGSSGRH